MLQKRSFHCWSIILIVLIMLAGCAQAPGSKGTQGAAVGAAGGALLGQAIGRNTEATLIGTALGTMLGYIVGNEMDKFDRQNLNSAYETGRSGVPVSWTNPDSQNSYAVTPQPAYEVAQNRYCRKAEIMATIDGRPERTVTTACRDASGSWVLQ